MIAWGYLDNCKLYAPRVHTLWTLLPFVLMAPQGHNSSIQLLWLLLSMLLILRSATKRFNWVIAYPAGQTYYCPYNYKGVLMPPINRTSMVLGLSEQYLISAKQEPASTNFQGDCRPLNTIRIRDWPSISRRQNLTAALWTAIYHDATSWALRMGTPLVWSDKDWAF